MAWEDDENVVCDFSQHIRCVQDEIVSVLTSLEGTDGKKFRIDDWDRSEGTKIANGRACTIADGKVFEKGGVNVSLIMNMQPNSGLTTSMLEKIPDNIDREDDVIINVSGISAIFHPVNPYCPTFHMNCRVFELKETKSGKILDRWYGGGADLTPHYVYEEDAIQFHTTLKKVCDTFSPDLYPKYKKDCDNYFYLKHRKEHRGIGGIFFDYLQQSKHEFNLIDFVKLCTESFVKAYYPIICNRTDIPFTEKQVLWQKIRRSRYAEFNLLYDRGTKFGLSTPGVDIENVLVSLPPICSWIYKHECEKGSSEEATLKLLTCPREWVS